MRLERLSLEEWESALPDDGFGVFHTPEALSVLDDHTPGRLVLLGAFKGERPTALLPAFVRSLSVGKTVTSPPPGKSVPQLGPLMMPASPKRRKHEKLNREFTDLVADEFGLDEFTTLFQMTCNPTFSDPRPYTWQNFNVETRFTYQLDTTGTSADALLKGASKSLRREIRDARELDVTVQCEPDGARSVYEAIARRYAEQDEAFSLTWPYVRDLVAALDDRARVYVARGPDGEFLSGVIVLYSNDVAYFWLGGGRVVHEGTAVNSLVHWQIVEDLVDDPPRPSIQGYDLLGANTERLCRYKSKFGAELTPYYVVESNGPTMDAAKRAYQLVAK